jgi:glutamyl-tRNA reductase
LAGKTVLVVGAGKMGAIAARRLRAEGAAEIIILNRSHGRAADVAGTLGPGARVADLPGIKSALAGADVVVTSTGASTFVITVSDVAAALATRPDRPLFIVDIAVPRDVDPEVAGLAGVGLVDIDGLADVIAVTLERRREAVPLVEEIVARHVARFAEWYQSRTAVPVIASLVQKAETIREGEVARLLARCPQLSERERTLITGMSLTIVSKLLHSAITRIRDKAIENGAEALTQARMLDELFELRALETTEAPLRTAGAFDEAIE